MSLISTANRCCSPSWWFTKSGFTR